MIAKKQFSMAFVVAAVAGLVVLLTAHGSASGGSAPAAGAAWTYQGRLARGGQLVDGDCELSFGLWDAETGGSLIAELAMTVPVRAGVFVASLDFGASPPPTQAAWLEVAAKCPPDAGQTVLPRQAVTGTPYARAAGSVPWSGLTGRPAGLDDGDTDTTYTVTRGLILSGTVMSVDLDVYQRRVSEACPADYAIQAVITQTGTVICTQVHHGTITSVQAGYGLSGGGDGGIVELKANEGILQARIQECLSGRAIRSIDDWGTPTCEIDSVDFTGSDPIEIDDTSTPPTINLLEGDKSKLNADTLFDESVSPSIYLDSSDLLNAANVRSGTLATDRFHAYDDLGAELKLNQTEDALVTNNGSLHENLNADMLGENSRHADFFQPDITGSCPNKLGQVCGIKGINEQNAVICECVGGGNPGSSAVSTGDTKTQRLESGSCGPGASIRALNAGGSVECEPDDPAAGITSIDGRDGVLATTDGATVTVALDPTVVQTRVSGVCPAGSALRAVTEAGGAICEPDDAPVYTAGPGVTLLDARFSANLDVVQHRLTAACPENQAIRAISAAGVPVCEPIPQGDITGITTGRGLTGGGSGGSLTISTTLQVYPVSYQAACGPANPSPRPVEMRPAAGSFCALTGVQAGGVGAQPSSYCRVYERAGSWWLAARCGAPAAGAYQCRAMCMTW